MSKPVQKGSEVWDQIEIYALAKLNEMFKQEKSSGGISPSYVIWLYKASSQKLRPYSVTESGLKAAVAAMSSGDAVQLPACTIAFSGVLTIPAGGAVGGLGRDSSILSGQINLGAGAILDQLSVTLSGAVSATAVVGPSTGIGYVVNCKLSVLLTGGIPALVETIGGAVKLLGCELICKLNNVDQNPFRSYSGVTTFNFTSGPQGWTFSSGDGASGAWANQRLEFSGNGKTGKWSVDVTGLKTKADSTITLDLGLSGVSPFKVDLVYSDDTSYNWFILYGNLVEVGRVIDTLPGSEVGKNLKRIEISATFTNANTSYFDNVILNFQGGGTVSTHNCLMKTAYGIPLEGERAVLDASGYPLLHANDTDLSASSLHHTLGTGANQGAAGNHTHSPSAGADSDAFHKSTAAEFQSLSEKLTLSTSDAILIEDIDTTPVHYGKKFIFFSTLVSALQSFFSVVSHTHAPSAGADTTAIHDNVANEISAITEKTTPVDADVALIEDSAATNAKKKLSWANIKATLKTYFDTLYAVTAKGVTNGDTHDHNGGDGAQIDHVNLTNKGTNAHTTIDTFIASKGQASGLASLSAASLVVQNPASASATPAANTIPITNASGNLEGWTKQFFSGTIALADDTATSVTPPHPNGIILIGFISGLTSIWGMAHYRVGGSPVCVAMLSGPVFAVTTGVLTGTTGVDGKLTISAASDGKIYFENRLGVSANWSYTFLGT